MPSTKFIIGTVLSILGMIFTVFSFQWKSKKMYLIFQIIGSVFFTISYFFLGAGIGLILNFVFLARNFAFMSFDSDKHKKLANIICYILDGLYVVCYIIYFFCLGKEFVTFDYIQGLIPVLGALSGTKALTETVPGKIRLWKLPDHVCWLIYNSTCLSIGGILCEIFNIISNLISIYRFRNEKNGETEKPKNR